VQILTQTLRPMQDGLKKQSSPVTIFVMVLLSSLGLLCKYNKRTKNFVDFMSSRFKTLGRSENSMALLNDVAHFTRQRFDTTPF
jgi:hypothetical protein